jgi:uncharacterized membrane protein YGL010W
MPTPFRPAVDLLGRYAEVHRDRRNIQTHLVGVPLIVLALGLLLARPAFELFGLPLTPAWVLFAPVALWYLTRGHLGAGLAATLLIAALLALAQRVPTGGTLGWLAFGIGVLVLGSAIQFLGHYYEGRRPAFLDDATGLLVGPMFVAVELLAPLGLFKDLTVAIERHAGPTHLRDLAHPA